MQVMQYLLKRFVVEHRMINKDLPERRHVPLRILETHAVDGWGKHATTTITGTTCRAFRKRNFFADPAWFMPLLSEDRTYAGVANRPHC